MKWKYTKKWLKDNYYDGLVNPGICGCHLGNLHECAEHDVECGDEECSPAYMVECHHCGYDCDPGAGNPSYCMTTNPFNPVVRQKEQIAGRWTDEREKGYQIHLSKSTVGALKDDK